MLRKISFPTNYQKPTGQDRDKRLLFKVGKGTGNEGHLSYLDTYIQSAFHPRPLAFISKLHGEQDLLGDGVLQKRFLLRIGILYFEILQMLVYSGEPSLLFRNWLDRML